MADRMTITHGANGWGWGVGLGGGGGVGMESLLGIAYILSW